jgi:hypothetical protein
MGMAYLLMLIVYIGVSVGIYKLVTKPTSKRWIKGSLVAFFVLLPTYDIIITKALLFYYCNYTEKEKVYKTVENPESVYFEDKVSYSEGYSKTSMRIDSEYYLLKKHLFNAIEFYGPDNTVIHVEEKDGKLIQTILNKPTAQYSIIFQEIPVPPIISSFIVFSYELAMIDNKDKTKIGMQKSYVGKVYNMWLQDILKVDVQRDGCMQHNDTKLIEGITNGNKQK